MPVNRSCASPFAQTGSPKVFLHRTMADELIYHYTDGAGLLGILGSKSIWCTHLSYLNDASEHKYAWSIYSDLLSRALFTRREVDPRFAQAALMCLNRQQDKEAALMHPRRYFVASFSEKGDDLAQWRGYAGAGPRFAIGFRKSELEKLLSLEGMRLGKINYDAALAQEDMFGRFLAAAAELKSKWLAPETGYANPMDINPSEYNELNGKVVEDVAPLLKHWKFREEAEWRLFSDEQQLEKFREKTVHFRVGKSFLVPYISVDLSKLDQPVATITVGPTPHPEEARASVMRLLGSLPKATGGEPFRLLQSACGAVRSSDIPFRDW